MYKKKTLAVAIASALTVGPGVATADFTNVYDGMTPPALTAGSPSLVQSGFDFDAATTVIKNEKDGVIYATELFGTGADTLILPTVGANATGTHAAVIYQIDGNVSKAFDITFTLSSGATFAEDPKVGVDTQQAANASDANGVINVDITTGNAIRFDAKNASDNALLKTPGSVIQISGALYKVIAAGTDATGNYANIEPLGSPGASSLGVTILGDATPVAIYTVDPLTTVNTEVKATANTYLGDTANNNLVLIQKAATGPVDNAHNFEVGVSYQFGAGDANVYKVVEAPATGVTAVAGSPENRCGHSSNVGNCLRIEGVVTGNAPSLAISRRHLKDDKKIQVQTAALPLLTGSDNNVIQFAGYSGTYTVVSNTEGTGGKANLITLTSGLTENIPEGTKIYSTFTKGFTAGSGSATFTVTKAPKTTAVGKSTAVFELDGITDDKKLGGGSRIMMVYKLNKATALASPGQEIKMQVSLLTPTDQLIVQPARDLVVARSKDALKTVDMNAEELSDTKISVESDSTAFTGGSGDSFVGTDEVRIGKIDIDNEATSGDKVKTADGETDFLLGQEGAKASLSTLEIADGQFAASLITPGKVFINDNGTDIAADNVTATTAKFELNDTRLASIVANPQSQVTGGSFLGTGIQFKVDGNTGINIDSENPPTATLKIDFDIASSKDLDIEAELIKIPRDGTTCTVYNVPYPGALDKLNIRITNESSSLGELTCTLIDEAGTVLYDDVPCFDTPIKPMETRRLSHDHVKALGDGSADWNGQRAVLVIESKLPKLEVFGLLRNIATGSPLTNMSLGAKGQSCSN